MNETNMSELLDRPIVSLKKFSESMGISDTTAWRWRKNGWLKAINIAGRPYLTGRAVEDFLARAEAGEFAKEPRVPRRKPD
jgi:predicted site-specific integrase-resolvase